MAFQSRFKVNRAVSSAVAFIAVSAVSSVASSAGGLFTTEDRVQLLYSNRFVFDRRGIPLIRVRIMEGQSRVAVSSGKGLKLMPAGPGGPEVLGGRRWEIKLHGSRPAKVRYWTVVARHPGAAGRWGRKQLAVWRGRKLEARLFEVGSVFAVSGQVVDNRTSLVGVEPRRKVASARRVSAALSRKYGVKTGLHAELVERSRGTIVARESKQGLRVVNDGMIWLGPRSGSLVEVEKVEYGKGYKWHGRADRKYWGMIYVAVDRRGKLAVVNAVPADRLLAGLVPAEIFPSAPPAALRAQAVAARGQLLAKLGKRHLADPYLLCAAQHCQVYSGAGKEHPRTTRAVKATRGLILLDSKGHLADTVYHSCCGGHTEDNEKVWRTTSRDHLRGRADMGKGKSKWSRFLARRGAVGGKIREWLSDPPSTYCLQYSGNRRSLFRWKVARSAAALSRSAGRKLGVGRVTGISVLERGVSGRAVRIKLRGSKGVVVVRGELRIRRLLGNLKSSMFTVRALPKGASLPKRFIFRGGGWGHGVGMCQYGAMGMAKAGKSFRQILSFYYRHTKLVRLYSTSRRGS